MSYQEFANQLLPATIANALSSPFYQDLYGTLNPFQINTVSLQNLPFVDRSIVQSELDSISLVGFDHFDEIYTGGTTGPPLIFPVSETEKSYIQGFTRQAQRGRFKGPLRRSLFLHRGVQLRSVKTPAPMRSHVISVYDQDSFNHARRILLRNYRERDVAERCTVIIGEETLLRTFTLDCMDCEWEKRDAVVDLVITYGQYLTTRWRRLYTEYWGANLVDRYGLAEVYGGATQGLGSGLYFFDPPCFAEIVDLTSSARVESGLGELVLTPLYPFQQAFPLVRYRTGDLVQVAQRAPLDDHGPAIKPLGRVSTAVSLESGEVIPGVVFYESLDEFPQIARTQHYLDAHQLRSRRLIGHPKYRCAADPSGGRVTLTLETESGDPLGSDEQRRLIARIHELFHSEVGDLWPQAIDIDFLTARVESPMNPSDCP